MSNVQNFIRIGHHLLSHKSLNVTTFEQKQHAQFLFVQKQKSK